MASQALKHFASESSQPLLLREVLPGPGLAASGWAPCKRPGGQGFRVTVHLAAPEMPAGSSIKDASCVKGLLVALGLEGATALGIFCVWQLWHLVR